MVIQIEPITLADVDTVIRLQWAAFSPIEANMIFPMIYPHGLQADLLERMKKRWEDDFGRSDEVFNFCARESTTGEMLAAASWILLPDPPRTKEEIDARYEETRQKRFAGAQVEGANREMAEAFFRSVFYTEHEILAGRPALELRLLMCHPNHARKGTGTLLLRHGLAKADSLGLPVYLDSAKQGRALYERFGFHVVRDLPFNALDHGGRTDGKHWCMLRPALIAASTEDSRTP